MRIAGTIYGSGRTPFEGCILVEQGRIAALEEGVRSGADLVDLRPFSLVPGLIDLHIHGGGGWEAGSFATGATEALGRYLASQGTTAYYATLPAMPQERFEEAIDSVARSIGPESPEGSARLLGLHLEGPMLNPRKKGAMSEEALHPASAADMERWLELGKGHVRQVTIAPELHGAPYVIRMLAARGVTVSGGHTDATYAETIAGIDAGVTVATHTYNAMRGLDHRSPGAVGAYLTDPRVTCELICDCLHVHPAAMKLVLSAKGLDRVTVISDATALSGLPTGHYAHGPVQVHVDEAGTCRMPDGTLAGATFHQVAGVRNLITRLGLGLDDAVRLAATNPARVAGVAKEKGRLQPGFDADIVALDSHLRVQWTMVEGRVAYRAGEGSSRLNPDRRPLAALQGGR
jgi:N-acetylglucosamine-6-phosphate deacetylase